MDFRYKHPVYSGDLEVLSKFALNIDSSSKLLPPPLYKFGINQIRRKPNTNNLICYLAYAAR
jgi:hypothetical protein